MDIKKENKKEENDFQLYWAATVVVILTWVLAFLCHEVGSS
jgi:hypothetical protein